MVIRELSWDECLQLLAKTRIARLGCASGNQPYVVPVYLALGDSPDGGACLYGFTTPGQKIDWMRANPQVCVEADDVTAYDRWVSVVVFGRYEELPETRRSDEATRHARELLRQTATVTLVGEVAADPSGHDERLRAYELLRTVAEWWEPAWAAWAARAQYDPARPYVTVYYKVRIDRVTGYEAVPHLPAAAPVLPGRRLERLRNSIGRWFGGRSE